MDGPKAKCLRVFAGHSAPIVSLECTDDRVLSTSFDGTCRIWDWEGRQLGCIEAHEGHASGLALVDGVKVLTGGDDGFVKQVRSISRLLPPSPPFSRLLPPSPAFSHALG